MSERYGGLPMPATTYYRTFGDVRPPVEDLTMMFDQLQKARPHRVFLKLVCSEVALDLAVADTPNADVWVDRSAEALNEIATWAQNPNVLGAPPQSTAYTTSVAAAHWRRAELDNWRRVTQGEPVQNDYPSLAQAASDTLSLLRNNPDNEQMHDNFTEFLVLLMGARAQHRNNEQGWLGRLAFLREEGRTGLSLTGDENPNWDVGICADTTPESFTDPTTKLQLKHELKKRRGTRLKDRRIDYRAYEAAGVTPVASDAFYIGDPHEVVFGCLQELGQLSKSRRRRHHTSRASSIRLDNITQRMADSFEIS